MTKESAKEQAALSRASSSSSNVESASGNAAGMTEVMVAMHKHVQDMSKQAAVRDAHAKQLAAVVIKAEDLAMLTEQFDSVPKASVERHLRQCGGDVSKAVRQLLGLEPLTKGP